VIAFEFICGYLKDSMSERIYRDPVHNIIRLRTDTTEGELMMKLIDASEFQRLRRIKQLGLGLYTYQGAEHSRFTHSLGAFHLMTRVLDRFSERYSIKPDDRIAARAAALLHDVGHGSFSHVMEKVLNFHHEQWTVQVMLSEQTEIGQLLRSYSAELPGKVASIIEPMSGTVEDAAGRMKAAALDWSSHHTDSAKSFLDTSYQMLSAGLNERQAAAATKSAMLVATAAMGDATQAGQLLATLYNNMGDKLKDPATEFAHLGDVVTQTQAVFQFANFDTLNEGLKYGVPVALQYGINIEQLSTAIGLLNNAGLQGSQAGTSFAASMSKMSKASGELGFKIAKAADGGVDFGATLENLHKKLGPVAQMSDAMKVRLQKAFGEEGVRAISLLADKSDEFGRSLAKVRDNAGVAARATAVIERAGSGPYKIMMNRWENMKTAMGDALSPALGPMTDGIGKVVDSIGGWVKANEGLITGGIESALTTLAPIVREVAGAFVEGFTAVMPAVKAFARFMFNDFGSKADWVGVLKRAAQIVGGLTVAAIGAAAVFGGVLAAGFAETVALASDVVNGWNWMIDGIGKVLFAVDNFFANLGAKWRAFKFADLANYLIDGLVNGIVGGAQRVADAITGLGQQALDALKGIWDSHSPAVKFTIEGNNAADGVVKGVMGGIPKVVAATETMADKALGAMAMIKDDKFGMPAVNALSLGSDKWSSLWPGANGGELPANDDAPASRVPVPQISPSDAALLRETISRQYSETKSTGELVIRDESGRAKVTKPPKGNIGVRVAPSGGI